MVEKSQKYPEKIKNSVKNLGISIYNTTKTLIKESFDIPKFEVKSAPMYNTLTGTSYESGPPYGTDPKNWYQIQPYNYKSILDTIKRCPEAIGIINELKTSILSDGFRFETVDGGAGGRNKIKKANEFVEDNFFKQELEAALQDWFIMGDCALWKGKISLNQLKEKFGDKLTDLEYKQVIKDEDDIKSIKHIPWSTMKIAMNADHTAIGGFEQDVNGIGKRNYDTSEVIHGKLMTWDGKAYGYSPAIAGLSTISQLNTIKDLNGMWFEKGGTPDWLFILEKEAPNSQRQRRLEQLLREYQQRYQKHGNLVMTGEVKLEQLNKFDKDMEFRQQAIYLTGVLALSFNMPMSKINVVVGTEAKAGARSEDISDQSYHNKISEAQDYWEQLLNTQLFKPHFGVNLRFNRNYKNDEIKETQANLQHKQYLDTVYESGLIKNNDPEFAYNLLKIPDKYRSNKPYELPMQKMGMGMPGKPGGGPKPANNPKVMDGPATNKMRENKKDEQNAKKEYKEIISLSWDSYKELRDKLESRKPMTMSGIVHYYTLNNLYIIYYSTPDFKYYIEAPMEIVGDVDATQYILKDGIKINGRVSEVTRPEVV